MFWVYFNMFNILKYFDILYLIPAQGMKFMIQIFSTNIHKTQVAPRNKNLISYGCFFETEATVVVSLFSVTYSSEWPLSTRNRTQVF